MIKRQTKSYTKKEIYKNLHPYVKTWFDKNFDDFTPAQKQAIPEIHKGRNILVSSPTGSGKTLTAFLSIINELTSLAQSLLHLHLSPQGIGQRYREKLEKAIRGNGGNSWKTPWHKAGC